MSAQHAWSSTRALFALFAASLLILEACSGRSQSGLTPPARATTAKYVFNMDATSPVGNGYRADVGGVSRYFPANSTLRRQSTARGEMLVVSGKGFSTAFSTASSPQVYTVKNGVAAKFPLSRAPLLINRSNCLVNSIECAGQPGCDASSPTCYTCSDCEGIPGAGPAENADGTSICIVGSCGVDDFGNGFGIATFRNPFIGVSCNVEISSLEMNCEFGDQNSGPDSGLDLLRSYSYFGGSHHLDCNPYSHYALVWVTFTDPAAVSTMLSVVPANAEGEWVHASAFVTGTSMYAQYKSLIPLRQVAHCHGTD